MKFWNSETFEISSYKFSLDTRINGIFNTCGSDNTGKCTYTYNELGFRGDSLQKDGFKVMSIGCSLTEGVGLNDDETWSHNFTKLIPKGVDLNFGLSGRSNDYISRCLLSYYDLIKPDLVLIMYTSLQRREIYTKDGGIEPFMKTTSWGYLNETEDGKIIQDSYLNFSNDNDDLYNWYKNHQLIKYYLGSKNTKWLWNGSFGVPENIVDSNRFDGNYKSYIDFAVDGVHPGPEHNKTYAKKLFDFYF